MLSTELTKRLKWGSTWTLFGLALVTWGVYIVYYARRQTLILNDFLPPDKQISLVFFRWWLFIAYSSLAFFVLFFFLPKDSSWNYIGTFFDRLAGLLDLIWAFMARSQLHRLYVSEKETPPWFHAFWTFIFQAYYINFKINKLLEAPAFKVPAAGDAAVRSRRF